MALSKIQTEEMLDTPIVGRRNLVINGAMNVWQRATTVSSTTANTYPAADRWKFWVNGSTMSTTRTAFTVGQTDVPNFKYYNRIVIASNTGNGHYHTINQHIEDITLFDNRQITVSFYAKASVAWTIGLEPIQNFGSGGSPSSRVLGTAQTVSVGTSWERHTATFTLASISGKTLGTDENTSNFELAFWLSAGSDFDSRAGSIGNQSGTVDITGVQIEYGDKATPFEHRSYGEELALCQRYYQDCGRWHVQGYGYSTGSDGVGSAMMWATTMRDAPTMTKSNTTDGGSGANMVFNNITIHGCSPEAVSTNSTYGQWYIADVVAEAEL